jgi:hypothetical protein
MLEHEEHVIIQVVRFARDLGFRARPRLPIPDLSTPPNCVSLPHHSVGHTIKRRKKGDKKVAMFNTRHVVAKRKSTTKKELAAKLFFHLQYEACRSDTHSEPSNGGGSEGTNREEEKRLKYFSLKV